MPWVVRQGTVCRTRVERGSLSGTMAETEKREVHRETMCCGYAKCPEIVLFDDGSAELIDDDPAAGSVGTIKLRPEVAARLGALLAKH